MIMITQRTHHRLLLLLAFAWLVVHAQAKGGGGGGKGGGGGRGGKSGGKTLTKINWSTSSHFFLPASAGGRPYDASKDKADDDVKNALQIRQIHGIIAAIAFVGLFPVGAVLKRVLPRRWAGPVHSLVQWVGWMVWLVAATLGMVLMGMVDGLLRHPSTRYHLIIGLVVFAFTMPQPFVAIFMSGEKRGLMHYIHLFLGRVFITLGMVNGFLGLHVSDALGTAKTAYAVVAAFVWVAWMGVANWTEIKKAKESRKAKYEVVSLEAKEDIKPQL